MKTENRWKGTLRAVVGAFALASLLFSNVLIISAAPAAGNAERNLTGTTYPRPHAAWPSRKPAEDLSIERSS